MPRVFRVTGAQVARVPTSHFPSHEALRKVVEGNLPTLFGLAYLESDFHLVDLPADAPRECREIDTLAFDPSNYTPVAIEYRERASVETASEGVQMLRAVPTQSQVLKYLVKRAGFSPERIEWGKMRVLFLAREAAPPAQVPSRSRDGGIELWECTLYAGDFLVLDHVVTFPTATLRAAPGGQAPPKSPAPAAAPSL